MTKLVGGSDARGGASARKDAVGQDQGIVEADLRYRLPLSSTPTLPSSICRGVTQTPEPQIAHGGSPKKRVPSTKTFPIT